MPLGASSPTPPVAQEGDFRGYDLDVIDVIDKVLLAENRKDRGRRRGVFHPSELGNVSCDRALAYELLRAPKAREEISPRLRRIFNNGTYLEYRLDNYFKRYGQMDLFFTYKQDVPVEIPEFYVSGEADALFCQMVVGEFKSINKNGFTGLSKPKPAHRMQINTYMWGLGFKNGVVLYECKDNQSLKAFDVRLNAPMRDATALRCRSILDTVRRGDLPAQITAERECRVCAFYGVCKGRPSATFQPDSLQPFNNGA